MAEQFQFGLDTFGDVSVGGDGRPQSHAQVIRDLIEEAVLADQLGVNAFGVGEHHRPDFAVSAPDVAQYEVVYEEKADLFAPLVKTTPVTGGGRLRRSLKHQPFSPPIETGAF